jgi:hypothetical protein
MNKFQAMAQIMAILCEDGHLQPGTQEYKIARKLVSSKIDTLGPDVALEQAKKSKGKFLEQESAENILEELREKFPYLNI